MSKPITIALTSHKGGTGKTTITWGLATTLAHKGFKVLMVDLDEQGNLSLAMGYQNPEKQVAKMLRDFKNKVKKGLTPDLSWQDTILRDVKPNLDLLPGGEFINEHELLLSADRGAETVLRDALDEYASEYDFIFIDCPPQKQIMAYISLAAATHYIVPIQGENFAYHGLTSIYKLVDTVKQYYNPLLKLAGVVLNRFQEKTIFGREILTMLEKSADISLFNTRIRQSIPLMEATAVNQTIFEYAPDSNGSTDFMDFALELCTQLNYHTPKKTPSHDKTPGTDSGS